MNPERPSRLLSTFASMEAVRAVIKFEDQALIEHLQNVTRWKRFDLRRHSLYLYGICSDCQKK